MCYQYLVVVKLRVAIRNEFHSHFYACRVDEVKKQAVV